MIQRLLSGWLSRLRAPQAVSREPRFVGHVDDLAAVTSADTVFLCGEAVYVSLNPERPDAQLVPQPPRRLAARGAPLYLAVHREALSLTPAPRILHDQYLAWLSRQTADCVLIGGHVGPLQTNLELFVMTVTRRGPLYRRTLRAVHEYEIPRPDHPDFAGELLAAVQAALADHPGLPITWAAPLPEPPEPFLARFPVSLLDAEKLTRSPSRRRAVDPSAARTAVNWAVPVVVALLALIAYVAPPVYAYWEYRGAVDRYQALLAELPEEMARAGLPALTRRAARDTHLRRAVGSGGWFDPLGRVVAGFARATAGDERVLIRRIEYAGPAAPILLEVAAPATARSPDRQAKAVFQRVADVARATLRKPDAQWRTTTLNGRSYHVYTVEVTAP